MKKMLFAALASAGLLMSGCQNASGVDLVSDYEESLRYCSDRAESRLGSLSGSIGVEELRDRKAQWRADCLTRELGWSSGKIQKASELKNMMEQEELSGRFCTCSRKDSHRLKSHDLGSGVYVYAEEEAAEDGVDYIEY